ncbi:MAG: VOC family protein [Deltaproteobacteria bacterium]|nr:VOC family protein [Deltaproteobacteria bacterium]MBW2070380.1 VOC family protein [Deltaproteobacteria bacterium]
MQARYKHTNIIARDWQRLAEFYQQVFGCQPVPPERHLAGETIDRGTGVPGAKISGIHLRLPGWGDDGPTLEIFQYAENAPKLPPAANREGFSHIAFEVADVERAAAKVVSGGGSMVGHIASLEVRGAGRLTFVYAADPEGNIIELQAWQ